MILFLGINAKAQEISDAPAQNGDLVAMLQGLKQSADQLKIQNAQLKQNNVSKRQEITQLQMKLAKLREYNAAQTQKIEVLKEKNDGKARIIAQKGEVVFQMDNENEKLAAEVKSLGDQLAMIQREDASLDEQLAQFAQIDPNTMLSQVDTQDQSALRKEKISLLKMISDSRLHQQELQMRLSQMPDKGPNSEVLQLMLERDKWQKQIDLLKNSMDAEGGPKSVGPLKEDLQEIKVLTKQMNILEKNYAELKELHAKMKDKARGMSLNVDQRVEKEKLMNSLSDLSREGAMLKGQLHDLREQMVELDKRKTNLQKAILSQ